MWEKKGLSTLITSLQRTLQYARGSTDTSSSSSSLGGGGGRTGTAATNATATAPGGGGGGAVSQALLGVNAHLHRSIWALTQHAHFAKSETTLFSSLPLLKCGSLQLIKILLVLYRALNQASIETVEYSFYLFRCTSHEIVEILISLIAKRSTGVDRVGNLFLIKNLYIEAPYLTFLDKPIF